VIARMNDLWQLVEDGIIDRRTFLGKYHVMVIQCCHLVEAVRRAEEARRGGNYGQRLLRMRQALLCSTMHHLSIGLSPSRFPASIRRATCLAVTSANTPCRPYLKSESSIRVPVPLLPPPQMGVAPVVLVMLEPSFVAELAGRARFTRPLIDLVVLGGHSHVSATGALDLEERSTVALSLSSRVLHL